MSFIKKIFGLFVTPEWTLASIGVRLLAALVSVGGVYYTVSTMWDNYTTSICNARVADVTSSIQNTTIKELQKRVANQAMQLQNLEARRADDQLAVQKADAAARQAHEDLKKLEGQRQPSFLTDAEVDILNGKTGAKK